MRGPILLALALFLVPCSHAAAHPVPRRAHDRVIVVRLTAEAVIVDYHLEVDDWTVVFADLPAVLEKDELAGLVKPEDYYEAFTRLYAPIFADNLLVKLDGKLLTFSCTRRSHAMADHLRCDFRFEAKWQVPPNTRHQFTFHEGNYELESGMLRLSLTNEPCLPFVKKTEPEEALTARPPTELKPGDEERLRRASATLDRVEDTRPPPTEPVGSAKPESTAGKTAKSCLKSPGSAVAGSRKPNPPADAPVLQGNSPR